MDTGALSLLLALTYFLIKHVMADFILQTPYQLRNKGIYGHPGGMLHAGIHAVLSVPVFLILPAPGAVFAGVLIAGELLVHYHVDWAKEQIVARRQWTPAAGGFWRALGIDQFIHHLTYVAMVSILVGAQA